MLLLTDIVDSTALNQELGDAAMAAVWREHDRLSRVLVGRWSGTEIGRSDGFFILFASADDALGFAGDYHSLTRRLQPPLSARVGVHSGPGMLRSNSDEDRQRGATPFEVDGAALPIAARIMATATGGQTLVSESAFASLTSPPLHARCHGHWTLKGVSEPIELFEVAHADSAFLPPPDSEKSYRVVRAGKMWLPRRQIPNSLPVDRDEFVGRGMSLRALGDRFAAGARLVSVLGIGGAGKTRLASRFGWLHLGDYPGGVWFCDLSSARSLEDIPRAVAQGLQVPLGAGEPTAQVAAVLAGREACLLVLDNFEQVNRFAEKTVGLWLDSAPRVKFLATTREVLGICGEKVFALPPLDASEGFDLFVHRASATGGTHGESDGATADVSRIVDLLDGLPLAIELAAARTLVMSPKILLAAMSERFKLLASRGGRQDRQSTLRKTFDWSWDLLSETDKSVLAQLAVFDGGISLAAAKSVLKPPSNGEVLWTVDLLQSLVEKSMLRVHSDLRFELLSTLQEYALEHLGGVDQFPESGPEFASQTRTRHYRFFARLSEADAVANQCIELPNLLAASRRAVDESDTSAAVDSLVLAWTALKLRGPFRVGLELAYFVSSQCALAPSQRATVDWIAGSALYSLGRLKLSKERLESGIAAARECGDKRSEARLLCSLGEWFSTTGDETAALESLRDAMDLAAVVSDPLVQLKALNELGALAQTQLNLGVARGYYERALLLAREISDVRWEGAVLGNLGGLLHSQEQLDDAARLYESAIIRSQQCGDRRMEGNHRCNLGLALHQLGNNAEALAQFEVVLTTSRELGNPRLESAALCNMGLALESQNLLTEAVGHQERASTIASQTGDLRVEGQAWTCLVRLHVKLESSALAHQCFAAGERCLVNAADPYDLTLLLCELTELCIFDGNTDGAIAALARAEAEVQKCPSESRTQVNRVLGRCRENVASLH